MTTALETLKTQYTAANTAYQHVNSAIFNVPIRKTANDRLDHKDPLMQLQDRVGNGLQIVQLIAHSQPESLNSDDINELTTAANRMRDPIQTVEEWLEEGNAEGEALRAYLTQRGELESVKSCLSTVKSFLPQIREAVASLSATTYVAR